MQEEEYARQSDYWQTPKKTIEDKYLDYLLKWMSDNKGKLFVAEVDNQVVGYVAVAIDDGKDQSPSIAMKELGYIPDFDVLREYQKQGIGKELIKAAEEYLKANNCSYVSLDVTEGNPALGFYYKQGYKDYSRNLKKQIN